MSKMYKAVFIDMDGTLLRKDHTVSDETRAYLQSLMAKGTLIVLVSARPFHGITPISNWLGLTESMPIISLNGAFIVEKGNTIFRSTIDAETTRKIHEFTLGFNTQLLFYGDEQWYAEQESTATAKEQRITDIPLSLMHFDEILQSFQAAHGGPGKIMAVSEPDVTMQLQSALVPAFGDELNIYPSKPVYLEIMRHNASKSKAIEFVSQHYGIKQEETIAIGDNYNDQGMIMWAGVGVAMGNAPDAIKAVADYVTVSNNEEGVLRALEHFIPLS